MDKSVKTKKLTYKDAGVNIDTANKLVEAIAPLAKLTHRPGVIGEIGGFGGLFSLNTEKFKNPVLVSSTDGVGTKLKIAFMSNKHSTIGIDLVAMNVNDILVEGAEPLFFLDYIATSNLNVEKCTEIVKGIVEGCRIAGCALLGGETAEMPSFYKKGEYDLAGFAVGIVERDSLIDGQTITIGDKIIGIKSNGLHSNGYSLVRNILFKKSKMDIDTYIPELQSTLGEELLKPTRIYVKSLLNLFRDFNIKGLAHITGGGIKENLIRILPSRCQAKIYKERWEPHTIFKFLKEKGNISEEEMMRTFNNGIGMIAIVPSQDVGSVVERLKGLGEDALIIGEIEKRGENDEGIIFL